MLLIEILIVLSLIVVNGLLAMSELAIVSARPSRLKMMVERGVVGSRRALALASNPGKFLSTVQIGITLVGVLSGAFSGATLGLRLAALLSDFGLPPRLADGLGIGAVVAIITYASLIVGELVPKQIALRNPEAVAARVAPAMTWLARIASPLVWLLDASGRAVLSLLGHRGPTTERVTEEEIRTLAAEAETAGILEPGEKEMIAGVMRLGDRPVRALMTPLPDVDLINVADDRETIQRTIRSSIHSRLPVWDPVKEEALGIIHVKDVLDAVMAGQVWSIERLIRPAPVIPETADALDVVATLKASPVHLGLVHDEYGVFRGIVTSTDILEAIVGTFQTAELDEPPVVRRDDGSYLVAGSMPVETFADLIQLPLPESRSFHTVAGFVLERFGRLPAVGDSFHAHGWRFEVVDLDGRRIDKIMVSRLPLARRASNEVAA